jgi:hypothetical protein
VLGCDGCHGAYSVAAHGDGPDGRLG